jgi:hypothetical protein
MAKGKIYKERVAGIAQWLEQDFCKVKVVGSNPSAGSTHGLNNMQG